MQCGQYKLTPQSFMPTIAVYIDKDQLYSINLGLPDK